ncbi:MAG: cyclomaltodextrinase N-terminal domain-containing protein, partial [bacterium]|nr:cyclomaltodextrinase N-terminal domain-containing protein [bacterium]MDD4460435.1 cyclomaltodextrinase N-terminal domain-containing protein [Proteiniphilum sp.]
MKKHILLIVLFTASFLVVRGETPRVEPSFWWSGMAETELQLMVSGDNIADYVPAVTSKHVTIREVVTLEN